MFGPVRLTPLAPPSPTRPSARVLALTGAVAVIGLFLGVTLFLFALSGTKGIIATLSATSQVIILPLIWARTGQRPRPLA